jgi:hypothetical protein
MHEGNSRRTVFSMLSVLRCYKQGAPSVESPVEFCTGGYKRGTERASLRISTVRDRSQGTAGEYKACWKKLRGCCGDL